MAVIGYYVTCDDALCDSCFQAEHGDDDNGAEDSEGFEHWRAAGGFEDWTEPVAIFEDAESDTPTHCKRCESLIEHALTSDGYGYVLEALSAQLSGEGPTGRKCIVRQWYDAYGDGIDGAELVNMVGEIVATWPERDEFSPPNAPA